MQNRPMSVLRAELMDAVSAAINEAMRNGLPLCFVADILNNISQESRKAANMEYIREKEQYGAALKAIQTNKGGNDKCG